jgi:hypothetical protein
MNLQVDLSVGHIIFCGMFTTSLLPCLLVIQWKTLLLVWFPFVDFSTFFSVNASSLQQLYQLMDVGFTQRKDWGKLMNHMDF